MQEICNVAKNIKPFEKSGKMKNSSLPPNFCLPLRLAIVCLSLTNVIPGVCNQYTNSPTSCDFRVSLKGSGLGWSVLWLHRLASIEPVRRLLHSRYVGKSWKIARSWWVGTFVYSRQPIYCHIFHCVSWRAHKNEGGKWVFSLYRKTLWHGPEL
jgi:hypothetical protein